MKALLRLLLVSLLCVSCGKLFAAPKPNVLIITVDDMSADSLGSFGCKLPDTSPQIDRLAAQGMRFNRAHVVVGNCFPSRNVMWSGLYPHNTGVEGFYQVRDAYVAAQEKEADERRASEARGRARQGNRLRRRRTKPKCRRRRRRI